MKVGDLSIVASTLHHSMKTLRQRWDDTGDDWRDAVRQNFEENHLAAIEPQLLATLKAVNRLSQVFARAREDCSPSDS